MPNGNIFDASLRATADLFAPYLAGSVGGLAIAISSNWLDDVSRNALESSLDTLGYGTDCLAYIALNGSGNETLPLDAQALFALVEGLDPKCLIATDSQAAGILAEAFHVKQILNAYARFQGRDTVAFSDFADLMNSPEEKQQAWHLLKKLPKLN